MRLLLSVFLSVFLFSLPVFGQTEKPQTIIVPTGSLGEISETRIKILEKTFESKLGEYFEIVPKQLFEEAQDKAFEELDYEECTEDQCIMMIQEMLQVENAFQLILIHEDGDTQLSVTWTDLDQKRVKEEYCEDCKTKELRKTIAGLVDKLVGVKEEVLVKEEPPKEVEPVVVETSKVVSKEVQEPVVQKIEGDKKNEMFVTVGDSGTILTSSNGTSWTKRISGTSNNLYGITYGNGLFVSVGYKGSIFTSTDVTSWTKRISGTSNNLYGISYGNGLFVTVGKEGTILTSSNGTSWTQRISGTSNTLYGVTYGNGLFVTVGNYGTIFTSSDGISWTQRTSPTGSSFGSKHHLIMVNYVNRIFVTVGWYGTILTSSNGTSWTKRRTPRESLNFHGVTYGNGLFVTVGESGILTSPNGVSWSKQSSSGQINGVTYGNGLFMKVGVSGTILTSSDGTSWTKRITGTSNTLSGIISSHTETPSKILHLLLCDFIPLTSSSSSPPS